MKKTFITIRCLAVTAGAALVAGMLGVPVAGAAPGDLDPTFRTGGIAFSQSGTPRLYDLALLPDGRMIGVGNLYGGMVGVVRFLSDGSLDESFGGRPGFSEGVVGVNFSGAYDLGTAAVADYS